MLEQTSNEYIHFSVTRRIDASDCLLHVAVLVDPESARDHILELVASLDTLGYPMLLSVSAILKH